MRGPPGDIRSNQAPPPPEVWCHEHHRPVGPDGRCALCVQGENPARSERRVVLVVIAIALLGGIGPLAYYFFWAGHAEDRRHTAKADRRADRRADHASKGKHTLVADNERWVDLVQPSTGMADDRSRRPRATPRKRRARHRSRRGGSRAMRSRTATPRPAARVSITMYMAHW